MKALFYFPINTDLSPDSGIVKKNNHIIVAVKKLGVETDVITFSNAGIYFNDSLIKKIPNTKVIRGLNNYILAYSSISKLIDFKEYDFIWMRAGLMLPPLFTFIKNIKRRNPKVKIILEYGAYPYANELVGHRKFLYPIAQHFEGYLKKYASYIITYCGQDEVFGIPNIKIGNGIDVSLIEWNDHPKPLTDTLHLVSVSSLMPWHGYDRIIFGIKNYYQNGLKKDKLNVIFHIVGEGSELENLRKITTNANLQDKIIFHGFKIKRDLYDVFDKCHIAIGTLGMHRIKLHTSSSLKNREYFSRGLPFILSTIDTDFPNDSPFIKYVPSDESPIDIDALIEFYKNILDKYPNYPSLIRKYAEENLTWESKIKQVLEAIKE